MSRWFLFLSLGAAACTGRVVTVEVAIPGADSVDAPVGHLAIVALPYDRDSLLKTFDQGRSGPAEVTPALDSLFERYRGPFVRYAGLAYQAQRLEGELARLQARLDSLPQPGSARDSLSRQLAGGSDSLRRLQQRRETARHLLDKIRTAYSPRMDSLRLRMAGWRDSTYRGWDSVTRSLGSGLGRELIADTTDAMGRVTIRLPRGEWWIHARSWDAWDPNREWYWNVRVTGAHVTLDRASGRRQPRY